MSGKARNFFLLKCNGAETCSSLNCIFSWPLLLINIAWSLTVRNTSRGTCTSVSHCTEFDVSFGQQFTSNEMPLNICNEEARSS